MKMLQPIALIGYLLVNLFTVLGYVKLLSYYTTTSPTTMFWVTAIFWMIIIFIFAVGLTSEREKNILFFKIHFFVMLLFAALISLIWILHTEGFFVVLNNFIYEECCEDKIITLTPKDLLFGAIIISSGLTFIEYWISILAYNAQKIKDLIIISFYLIIVTIIPFVLLPLVHSLGMLNLSSYGYSSVFLGVTNVLIFIHICIGLYNNRQEDVKKN